MKYENKKVSHRVQRMNDMFRQAVAQYLISGLKYESKNDAIDMVTVTRVKVTGDLQLARIYVTAFPPQDPKLIVKQLDSCAKEIRYHLAQELNLRRTPELEFFYDTEIEESTRIERIFYDLEQKKNKTEE